MPEDAGHGDAYGPPNDPRLNTLKRHAETVKCAVQDAFAARTDAAEVHLTTIRDHVHSLATFLRTEGEELIPTGLAAAPSQQRRTPRPALAPRTPKPPRNGLSGGRRGCRGTHRTRRAAGQAEVLFANITALSPKAGHYLLADRADCWLAVETHKRAHECAQWVRDSAHAGWRLTLAPAEPSLDSTEGSYGGGMAGVRSHLATSPVAGDVARSGWHQAPTAYVVGTTLQLRTSVQVSHASEASDALQWILVVVFTPS